MPTWYPVKRWQTHRILLLDSIQRFETQILCIKGDDYVSSGG